MPGFKFELSQLVMVPGKNQQGRVSGRMEYVNSESVYGLTWLDENLSIVTAMFAESEIVAAQDDRFADLVLDWTRVKAAAREKTIALCEPVLAAALAKSATVPAKAPAPRRKRPARKPATSRRSRAAKSRSRKARA